jgi:flagellar biosynthetic protein FlhB
MSARANWARQRASLPALPGWLAGPWLLAQLGQVTRSGFAWIATRSIISIRASASRALMDVLPPVLLLGVGLMAVALVSQLAFSSGRWNMGNLAPKGSRLDPGKGLARMFGIQGLIELGKA